MMPAAIGSGAFWKEATAWIAGGDSTDDMLEQHRSGLESLAAELTFTSQQRST